MRPLRSAIWLGGLLGAFAVLRSAGASGGPPVVSGQAMLEWVDQHPPGTVAVGLLGAVGQVAVAYLVALTALRWLARALRVRWVERLAEVATLPGTRRLVQLGLGVGAAATWSLPTAGAQVVDGTATMRPVAAEPPATPVASTPSRAGGTATMRPAPAPAAAAPAPPVVDVEPPSTWTVERGESFWTIAEELLSDAAGRPVTDGEVVPYWRRLVEANRHRLVEPGDPDLLLPGQVLDLPPLDGGGAAVTG